MKYPKKLKAGGTIGIVSPSSPVSAEREEQCVKVLENLGYKVKKADNIAANYGGYMAGTGETRGKWINKMFADPEVDAIICVRGGDGGHRSMQYIDADIVKSNPKIFVGYSDITSMHLYFNQKCGLVTFHGPMVSSNIVDDFDEETAKSFFDAINADVDYEFTNTKGFDIKALKTGKAQGQLVGGNLAILTASIGTPYELNSDGKILFIEEVGEDMCRIDRMIYQLRNSGRLDKAKGIILGQFTKCSNGDQPEYTELDVLKDALEGVNVPIMYNVQSGHGNPMMTLPFGAMCTMDTESMTIRFNVER
ncbi:S66 peptidase family protein [Aminicella lysinilytica]|jgi:muramoyltetrapeptide carboxypeptidase|uniref:S66 peptidase family protein n=1 Tax=Aminicella lysinilytica TaxID=433323 RepID=UPI0026ED2479|nr:LD-carboxypeptidase [Aminicella lysinilytica]